MTATQTQSDLAELEAELREVIDLDSISAVLEWDQSTHMPPRGAEARGRQMALLGRLSHARLTRPRVGELIAALRPLEEAGGRDGAFVRAARRRWERASRLPEDLVSELAEHTAASYVAWTRARPANDFAAMRPFLDKTVALSRRKAEHLGGGEHVADALIDQWDPGMTAGRVRALFAELRAELVPLIQRIAERPPPDDSFLRRRYDPDRQLAFGLEVAQRMGYDLERGRQDTTAHPFMTRFSAGDIRITTRVKPDDVTEALFGTIHEAGHALYELDIDPALDGTPLGGGVSAGVHESQSRLWENLVGRSRPFWDHFYPELKARFPEALGDVDVEAFHRAINRVQPSLIRCDADEVTYNLHVMLRFDLELAMLDGSLAVADLPDAWNERMQRDLGIVPPDDRDGVLQDVHWYVETVGGTFQGYTLGNLMSAQFHRAASAAIPDLSSQIARGDLSTLRGWLTEHVYRHGSTYLPEELVERATGAPLGIEPFMSYLRAKYGALYELD